MAAQSAPEQTEKIVRFDPAYRRNRSIPTRSEFIAALRTIERACRAPHEGTPSADRIADRMQDLNSPG